MASVIDSKNESNQTQQEHSRPSDGLKPKPPGDPGSPNDSGDPKLFSETVRRKHRGNFSTYSVIWLAFIHLVVATAAYATFSWIGLAVMVGLYWFTGSVGICLGYHRLLTHSGMKTYGWIRYMIAVFGTLAAEGSVLDWVADHRKHHAFSDQDGDPHSPHDGGLWAHMGWLGFSTHHGDRKAYFEKWVPDLYKDRFMRFLDVMFLPAQFLFGGMLFAIGYFASGTELAVSLLVWGLFVRMVVVLHVTWLVNSASHMFGYKNYETTDDSRNNWLVAMLAFGEGWHNNHHAYPRMAMHGHKWWEFDITWQAIRVMRMLGLFWDVVDYRNAAEKKAMQEATAAS